MVEATYTVSEKEFVEAASAYCKPQSRKFPGHWAIQVASGFFIGFAALTIQFNPRWLSISLLVSMASLFIVQQWRKKAIPVYQASAYAMFNEEVSVRFDEQGFHSTKIGLSSSWIAWSGFSGWQETQHTFVLGVKLFWVAIPKAAFDEVQQNELRALFHSRVVASAKVPLTNS